MALICEECGKIYHIDKDKLKDQIKGDFGKTKCRICGHIMEINLKDLEKTDEELLNTDMLPPEIKLPDFDDQESDFSDMPDDTTREKTKTELHKRKGFGLRTKMFLLFLIIPIALMAASGLYSQYQLKRLSENITSKGTGVVKDFAEKRVAEKARDVALQCQIYLSNHPELRRPDFNYVNEFRKIAVQNIGKNGYTALAERSLPTEPLDNLRIWAHPDPTIVGVPIFSRIKKELGGEFSGVIELLMPVIRGEEVSGYYKWKDAAGEIKEKFLVAVHVKQTKYVIIATAPIDEFTKPIRDLETDAKILTEQTRNINILILLVTLVVISLSILIYGYRITRNIKYLTETADRISVGDLDVEIDVKVRDEIGSLADAISRMQDSLRLSIERLRRRR